MSEISMQICPIFQQECLKEKCIGYTMHNKEYFKDTKLDKFVPIEDLDFYRSLDQSELNVRLNRIIKIIRECKLLGRIIEQIEEIDHLVPSPTQGYY